MLALAALAGCSKSESGNASFGDDVPVTLSAGIATGSIAPDSRAVVETGAAFTAGVAGWETSDVPAYGSAAEWYTTRRQRQMCIRDRQPASQPRQLHNRSRWQHRRSIMRTMASRLI